MVRACDQIKWPSCKKIVQATVPKYQGKENQDFRQKKRREDNIKYWSALDFNSAHQIIYLIIRRCARTGAFPGAFCVPNSSGGTRFTYPAGRELGHSLVPIRITARVIRLKKKLFPQHFRTNMADWLRFHFVIARRRYYVVPNSRACTAIYF